MERFKDCMYHDICKYEQECSPNCTRYVNTNYLLDLANIPVKQRGCHKLIPNQCDLEAFELLAEIRDNIDSFVQEGRLLYIWSNGCGNGKTTWALKLALQYINSVWQYYTDHSVCTFISVPQFLLDMKSFNNSGTMSKVQELKRNAQQSNLVIFDDIGCDYISLSTFDYTNIFALIEELNVHNRAMIFTSNHSPEALLDNLGNRVCSRICNDYVVEFKGTDRRGDK